jgi:uncharacterized protein YfdQ (DUF2303 family)
MADPQKKSEAEAVADLVRAGAAPQMLGVERGDEGVASALLVPNGMQVFSVKKFVDEYLPNPERRKGTAHFQELSSFVAHANRFKGENSAIFAEPSPTSPKLTSVIDYHLAGPDENREKARHGAHRGVYHFPLDEAWKTWTGVEGQKMSQVDFAEFIEANILDVVEPSAAVGSARLWADNAGLTFASPAQMMAFSRGLAVAVDRRVTNAIALGTGEGQISFSEEHKDGAGQPLRIPGAVLVQIPVFRSGTMYQVPFRLRYRVKDGGVSWALAPHRPDRYFDDAFLDARNYAAEQTKLPLFVGAPES